MTRSSLGVWPNWLLSWEQQQGMRWVMGVAAGDAVGHGRLKPGIKLQDACTMTPSSADPSQGALVALQEGPPLIAVVGHSNMVAVSLRGANASVLSLFVSTLPVPRGMDSSVPVKAWTQPIFIGIPHDHDHLPVVLVA